MTAPTASLDELHHLLKKHWGYDRFRPMQEEAIGHILARRDSLVVLPTGGGKSLCFQVPALAMEGTALVVSPLISLMKDQVDALRENGVSAACLHSGIDYQERRMIEMELQQGTLKLLYVSPERLMGEGFVSLVQRAKISFFAIDEAHCISMWGHDFRPEYRRIAELRRQFPQIGFHGFTATATPPVRRDILQQLSLRHAALVTGSPDRPNLVYKVLPRQGEVEQILEVVRRHPGESGIVYCIRRKDTEDVCAGLLARGIKAVPYHAGLSDVDRQRHQEAFIREEVDLVVATVAFGMGIDKSNVRFVVHAGMPKSIEHYQQESGRAGRDGLEAECVMLHAGKDFGTWMFIIKQGEPEGQRVGLDKLRDIHNYATATSCRRASLLSYFGEKYGQPNCNGCDVCLGEMEPIKDALVMAQKILSCVVRLKTPFGAEYVTEVLSGGKSARIVEAGHDQLTTWGILADQKRERLRQWIDQLVAQGCLVKDEEHSTLAVTGRGWDTLRGQFAPRLLQPAVKAARQALATEQGWTGVDRGLFEHLRQLRAEIAQTKKVPAYVVFSDATLRELAKRRPGTRDQFLEVPGVGEKKWDTYGEEFLAALADYCEEHHVPLGEVAPGMPAPVRRPPPMPSAKSNLQPGYSALFREGMSIAEVASAKKRAVSTVMEYLLKYITDDGVTDPTPWVVPEKVAAIRQIMHAEDTVRPKTIFDALDGRVSYDEIKIVLACGELG